MIFSDQQNQALTNISTFLSSSENIFLLKGYAGTGKTTILKELLNRLKLAKRQVRLMAPTGRAAMILSEKTNSRAYTIHKSIFNFQTLLEASEYDDFDVYFGLDKNQDDIDCVYLVDECSMIGNRYVRDEFFQFGSGYLLNDLIEYCIGDNRQKRKIIFIGDPAQLPPVGSELSPIFEASFLEKYNITDFTLTKVYRQGESSGILKNSILIRDCISNDRSDLNFDFTSDDISEINRAQLNDEYTKIARANTISETIILCHSNRAALSHVQNIRCIRYSTDDLSLIPQKKDRLLITKNNYNGEVPIFNGMFVELVQVGDIVRDETIHFRKKNKEKGKERIRWRQVKIKGKSLVGPFEQEVLLIEDLLLSPERSLSDDQTIALYVDFKNRMGTQKIREKSEEFSRNLVSDIYFNALQAKYGYAVTVHKSQGGEWHSAIVDMKTCMGKRSKPYLKWLYTAITRAKSNLYCIDPTSFSPISELKLTTVNSISKPLEKAYYYPNVSNSKLGFIAYQEERIKELCSENDFTVTFTDSQHLREFHFSRGLDSIVCKYWYSNIFFKKRQWNKESELKQLAEALLDQSILPDKVPFLESHEFQVTLYNAIIEICSEYGILITNIIQEPNSDTYYLKTDSGLSEIKFYYKDSGHYTSVVMRSEDIDDTQIACLKDVLSM